jgi:VIT1/CCC1 family predicted Fe2+/Mn2+ transporter
MSGGVRSVGVVAKEAREVLAELAAADLPALTDGEVTQLVVLAGEVAKLADAVFVQAVGRLGVLRAWEDSGARSAGTFVSWQCGDVPGAGVLGVVVRPGAASPAGHACGVPGR